MVTELETEMTKEEFIRRIKTDEETLTIQQVDELFNSSVIIPKGANRHPYADVLHEWIEGAKLEYKYFDEWSGISTVLESFSAGEYRIKPPEPIFEYQWLENGMVQNLGFYTEEELEDYPNKVYERIKATKRERKL